MSTELYVNPLTVSVFGDKKVGKTSLIRRFLGQGFSSQHQPTVEDYYEEEVARDMNRSRQLRILDTTGTYDFPVMREIAISKSEAFILVYSLDKPKSFDKIKWHRDEILKYKKDSNNVPIVVVCNKTDLTDISALQCGLDDGRIPTVYTQRLKEQQNVVENWGCKLMFTSAKVRWNINKVFYELVALQENKTPEDGEAIAIGRERRRSSLWFIGFPSNRAGKELKRGRSLSA